MRKRKTTVVLALILIFASIITMPAFSASAFEKDFTSDRYVIHYNTMNGLPDNTVTDIATTPDGIMWFATSGGLVRYDGIKFKLISKSNTKGFPATALTDLFVDSDGRLWIGSNDSGVICKDGESYAVYDINSGASSNSVRDISQRGDGSIVVATADGLFSVTDGQVQDFDNPFGIAIQSSIIAVDRSGDRTVCITSTGTVVVCDGNTVTESKKIFAVTDNKINCACFIGSDRVRFGTDTGEVIDFFVSGDSYEISRVETGLNIKKMYLDDAGRCWLLSGNKLGYVDADKSFHKVNGVDVENISAMSVDFQGNYWISSYNNGLTELCKSSFTNLNNTYQTDAHDASCVTEFDGNLYIGTADGLIVVNEKTGTVITNSLVKKLNGKEITDFEISNSGNLLIATAADGVFVYSTKGSIGQYTEKEGLCSNSVNNITLMNKGYLVIGYSDGISIVKDGKIIQNYDENNGLAGNVMCAYPVSKFGFWIIGTESNGGYNVTPDGQITSYSNTVHDANGSVRCMINSRDDSALLLGIGSGLYYSAADGVVSKIEKFSCTHNIVDIFRAPDGKLWIVTTSEVIVVDENNLLDSSAALSELVFDKSNGLDADINIYSYNYMSADGTLYLCTDEGVLSIDTTQYSSSQSAAKLMINELLIDDDNAEINEDGSITLPSDSKKLLVDCSVLSYLPYDDYILKYKLVGFDEIYTLKSAEDYNDITYTNLNGGSYTLEILVISTKDNSVLDSVSMSVKKEYSYFEQIMFKVLVVAFVFILVILFSYLLFIATAKRNKERRKKLQQITEQTMVSFAKVIDAKDPYTKGHSERVAKYAVEIARRYGLDESRLDDIYYSALLHDIGKIGIPDEILKKPEKLTDEEYEIIKTHTTLGAEILSDMSAVKNIQFGARDHHEKYDGTGYPRGLKGLSISFEGRVVGAADAYDAMSTSRGYNNTFNREQVKKEIVKQSGKQFDPKIAQIIIDMIDDGYFDTQD